MLLRARIEILGRFGLLLKSFSSLGLDLKIIHIFRQWLYFTQVKARALLFLSLLWIFVRSLMQFSHKPHSFVVWGIQEVGTKMKACTWLFTVCRTVATWGSSARLLDLCCVQ